MKLDSLSLEALKEMVKLAKEEGVLELKVEAKDFKVCVNFASAPEQVHSPAPLYRPAPASSAAEVKGPPSDMGLHVIKSPFVGTFYSAPSPGKPTYAKVGDKVKSGQPLCVLEAMKIMNEIDSDVNGEIIEICVDNESLVEFGQALFKIRPY